jgi:type I restriction enzyme, S subunit
MRPYMRAANVTWQGIDTTDVKEMDFTPAEYEIYGLRAGDILLGEASGSAEEVGKAAIWRDQVPGACFQNTLIRVRPADPNLIRFLHLHFVKDGRTGRFAAASRGVGIHHLGAETLSDWKIAFPPLSEQQRIVEATESYFTRLDDAVETLERVQRHFKRYRASVLKAAVEGRLVLTEAELARAEGRDYEPASVLLGRILAERRRRWQQVGGPGKYREPLAPDTANLPELPEGWCWATVEQVGHVSGGLTMNAIRDRLRVRLPYLRVANVYADELRLDDVKEIGVGEGEIERALLEPGDLLVVEGNGSIDQIGRVALWDGTIERCVHQNHLIKVRFELTSLGRWTLIWLLSPHGRRVVEGAASSTSGLHTLSLAKVGSLTLPLCPLAEQSRIIAEVDRLLSVIERSADTTAIASRRSERLRQAILKWAFEGKLVDQDPTDEPARALLERIRTETASGVAGASEDSPAKRRGRRGTITGCRLAKRG